MHRFSSCFFLCLLSACILHAAPPSVGQYEIRKRTATGFDSYGVTLINGQAIGQLAGIPAAITIGGGGGGATTWGLIEGTLADQTDLTAALNAKQATITDGSLTIARTNGLQAALDAKLSIATAGTTYQLIIGDGDLTIARTAGLQAALDAKESVLTFSTGLTRSTNTITVNSTQAISKLSNLTSNGFVKTSGGDGTLSVDSNTYVTTSDADTNYQPLHATLTALAGLTDSLGILVDNGSGSLAWYAFSQGGNAAADVYKFVQFTTGGTLNTSALLNFKNAGGYSFTLAAPSGSANADWVLPATSGTLALTNSNTTGTAAGLSSTLPVNKGGTGVTSLGTGVVTAMGVNIGSAGALVVFNGAGGTPSAITLTNGTGLPLSTGVTGDLPFANIVQATGASKLIGRGSASGGGDLEEITLGSGLTMTGTTLSSSSGGLSNLTEALATASPNNTVNAEQLYVTGGTTNVDLVLSVKAAGAHIATLPDSTSTGGNKRGARATDWQKTRSSATMVASGADSTISGGVNNLASGTSSTVTGGSGNSSSQEYATTGGFSNTASGSSSVAFGGYNVSSGHYTFSAGISNTASGSQSFSTGYSNVSSGKESVTMGLSNTASAEHASCVGGHNAKADRQGMTARASGAFSTQGDAQAVTFILRNKTTTNSAVELKLEGSSIRLTIPFGKAMYGMVKIIGMKSNGSAVATYTRQVGIQNVAGTVSLIGSVTTIGTDVDAGTTLSITADDTNDALNISPTGITSEVWRWVATFEGVEIAYGT